MLTQNTTQVVTFDGDEYDVQFHPAGSYGGWLIDVWIAYGIHDDAIVWDATGTCLNGIDNSGENLEEDKDARGRGN